MPVRILKTWFLGLVSLSLFTLSFAYNAAACDRSPVLKQMISGVVTRPAVALPSSGSALAAANAVHANSAHGQSGPVSIVGLWQVSFVVDGQVVDQSYDAWNLGGTEVLTDDTNPIEDNVCIGAWVQTGRRTYKLKHPSYYFDDTGTLQGTAILRDTVTVSRDGQSYSGTEVVDVYDTAGNFLTEITASLSASRVTVDF
jgi:hypothetical protein